MNNKILIITSSQKNYKSILYSVYNKITNDIVSIFISSKQELIESKKIYFIQAEPLNIYIIDEILNIIKTENPDIIITTSETDIKSLIARVAVNINSGILADVNEIKINNNKIEYFKYVYGGNYLAKLSIKTCPPIIIFKPLYSYIDKEINFENKTIEKIILHKDNSIEIINKTLDINKTPLENAKKVIGIGRGVRLDDIPLIEKFAKSINASIGYTRPLVHSGIADPQYQIGITGKIIAPDLYIALGVSGKDYHIKGVEKAKKIIAVNTDPYADIKKYSDIFINCDYRTFLDKILV